MKSLTQNDVDSAKKLIQSSLPQFENKKILVVGDIGLDEYLTGDVRRISPEAPVPVVEVKGREYRVGLAANVAQNIHSLGGAALMIGVVGKDDPGQQLRALLRQNGVSDQFLSVDDTRPTTRKVRVMSGQHHLLRVDFEHKNFVSEKYSEQMLQFSKANLKDCDGVIIQDYGKGVVSEDFCQKLIPMAHQANRKVIIDPHRTTPLKYYRGADYIKPNRDEAFILSGLNIDDLHLRENSIDQVAMAIQEQTGSANVMITEGAKGVRLYEGRQVTHVPTSPRQVFDVTGAGDTFVAAFALAWFSGLTAEVSAVMANFAAGVVVGKIGCVPCSKSELVTAMHEG